MRWSYAPGTARIASAVTARKQVFARAGSSGWAKFLGATIMKSIAARRGRPCSARLRRSEYTRNLASPSALSRCRFAISSTRRLCSSVGFARGGESGAWGAPTGAGCNLTAVAAVWSLCRQESWGLIGKGFPVNEVNLGGSWAGSWASVSVCGSRGSAVDSTGETGTRSLHSKPMGGKAGDSGSTVGSGTRGLARGGESDARTGDEDGGR